MWKYLHWCRTIASNLTMLKLSSWFSQPNTLFTTLTSQLTTCLLLLPVLVKIVMSWQIITRLALIVHHGLPGAPLCLIKHQKNQSVPYPACHTALGQAIGTSHIDYWKTLLVCRVCPWGYSWSNQTGSMLLRCLSSSSGYLSLPSLSSSHLCWPEPMHPSAAMFYGLGSSGKVAFTPSPYRYTGSYTCIR